MLPALAEHETAIRLGAFGSVFAAMVLWELIAPRRILTVSRWERWPNNIAIVVLNTLLIRLVIPTAAVGLALDAEAQGWGLFNQVRLPPWAEFLAAVVLFDLAVYLQHVMFHAVPALWRLHRMHHADLDFDVTTGSRFHPIEILLSMLIKMGVVLALGPAAAAVVAFEVLLNATSSFNHGNVRMPRALDRLVRAIVVTPDMHRVHHSIEPRETNSNFGFNLSLWDRLLGTYRAQPALGHEGMTIGITQFREPRASRLDRLLIQPFLDADERYSINRRD
jgi:sterol desaturase/sphingolipid hydroxylase (fatty acid hydroxylase superfamily)